MNLTTVKLIDVTTSLLNESDVKVLLQHEHEDQSTLIVKCTKEEAMNIVQDVKRNNAKLVVERNPQKVITNINDVHILKMKFIQEKLDNNNTAEEQKTELNSIDFVQKDEYALETLESDNEAHSKVEVYKLPLVNEDKEVSSLQEDKPLQEIYDRYLKSDKVLTLKEIQRLISKNRTKIKFKNHSLRLLSVMFAIGKLYYEKGEKRTLRSILLDTNTQVKFKNYYDDILKPLEEADEIYISKQFLFDEEFSVVRNYDQPIFAEFIKDMSFEYMFVDKEENTLNNKDTEQDG